jgi:Icc-related predicted phosphoesterase
MRVAVLCDIHGNLPALDAVLAEIRAIGVDRIVVGGDVLPGPMPQETMARLLELEVPT